MILSLFIKMLACSSILVGYYWLFLRNKRFHHYNRFYLLGITGLSITIPFIKIPIFIEPGTATGQLVNRSIDIISVSNWEEEFIASGNSPGFWTWFNWQNSLFMLYGLVILVLLYSLGKSLRYIKNLSNKYSFQQINSLKLYNTTEPGTPFSFFRSIFWNSRLDVNSKEGQQIFRHELFHVKQQHSADILLLEAICIFFWINPFFHLIKKEIKAIHEFLADQYAVKDNNQNEYAELLILQTLNIRQSTISNYFFQNHIKRRIAMITQFKSKKYSYWTRVLVLPLLVLLFCGIALQAKTNEVPAGKINSDKNPPMTTMAPLTVLIDAGHGGEDAGAKTITGLAEKDFCLAIARQIKQQATAFNNIKIIMTREDDVYPSLTQRSEMAHSVKADMLISVHVASGKTENEGGFDIYITNRNNETVTQSRVLGQHIADQIKTFYAVGSLKQRSEKGIWILDKVSCPAVLIECGYLTSENDLKFISNIENQQKIARNILEGIARYQARKSVSVQGDYSPEIALIADTSKPDEKEVELKKKEAQLKEAEARILELGAKQKALEQKQREMEAAHEAMARARKLELEADRKALDGKRQEMTEKRNKVTEQQAQERKLQQKALVQKMQDMELAQKKSAQDKFETLQKQQKDFEKKSNELESKHRKMAEDIAQKMELEQKAQSQKQHEMTIAQKQLAQDKFTDLQKEQKEFSKKRREIENQQRKMADDHQRELQIHEKALQKKRQDIEQEHRKMTEQKREELNKQRKELKLKEAELMNRKIEENRLKEIELKEKIQLQKEIEQRKEDTLENKK